MLLPSSLANKLFFKTLERNLLFINLHVTEHKFDKIYMTSWTDFLDNIKVTIRSDSSFFFVVKKSETQFNIPNICSKDFAMVFVIFMNIKIITFYVLKRI